MSVGVRKGDGGALGHSHAPKVDLLKSPARLLAHLQHEKGEEPVKNQLLEATKWILASPEAIGFCRLTALCYEVPTKLQDGPQLVLYAVHFYLREQTCKKVESIGIRIVRLFLADYIR